MAVVKKIATVLISREWKLLIAIKFAAFILCGLKIKGFLGQFLPLTPAAAQMFHLFSQILQHPRRTLAQKMCTNFHWAQIMNPFDVNFSDTARRHSMHDHMGAAYGKKVRASTHRIRRNKVLVYRSKVVLQNSLDRLHSLAQDCQWLKTADLYVLISSEVVLIQRKKGFKYIENHCYDIWSGHYPVNACYSF